MNTVYTLRNKERFTDIIKTLNWTQISTNVKTCLLKSNLIFQHYRVKIVQNGHASWIKGNYLSFVQSFLKANRGKN